MRHCFYGIHCVCMLLMLGVAMVWSGCSMIPKYATIQSEQPPAYYLGASPKIYVVETSGATRTLQDVAVEELRNQSRSNGYFTIEDRLQEGIRFDVRGGRLVMTGRDVPVSESDVFIKLNVIASMKSEGRSVVTRRTGFLGSEEEEVPVFVTVMPVAFTVTRGRDVLLDERQYDGRAVWPLSEGYPPDRYRRYEIAVGQAVKEFLRDVTPRYVSRRVRLDYSDEGQKPILDAARDGQVKAASIELEDYVAQHPNSASAVYNLAVLADALGDYAQAITYYDRALSLGGEDYYMEAKTECMRCLSEQREMEGQRAERGMPIRSTRSPAASTGSAGLEAEQPGNGGQDIAWVQRTLSSLGYDCGVVDGIMGANTHSCIRAFQEANGLQATGAVNEATYQKMLEVR